MRVASIAYGAIGVLLLSGLSMVMVPGASASSSTPISGTFYIPVFNVTSSHSGGGNLVFRANLVIQFNGTMSGNCSGPQYQTSHKGSNVSRLTGYCDFTGTVNGSTGTLRLHYAGNDVRTYKHGVTGQITLVGMSGGLSGLRGTGTFNDVTATYSGSVHFS